MARSRADISELAGRAAAFAEKFQELRQSLGPVDFEWYPYDTFGAFEHLTELLTGPRRVLLDLIGDQPVLDVGCGDGGVSFFLESLGCKVHAIDYGPTNYNDLQGVKALKAALNSSVEILEQDLDCGLELPAQRYELVFLLGVLYHLKNPFLLLETLARRARYCILSTRVARYSPDKKTRLADLPVAYLLAGEANQDPTNYWILSEAGLRRLMERSGWKIRDYSSFGNTVDSDPATWEGNERAYCFAESTVGALTSGQLVKGWHFEPGARGWCWTEQHFSVLFENPPETRAKLSLEFYYPPVAQEQLGTITVRASVNGVALAGKTYARAAKHKYVVRVPAEALGRKTALVEFALDKALPPSQADVRQLGIIVSHLSLSA